MSDYFYSLEMLVTHFWWINGQQAQRIADENNA